MNRTLVALEKAALKKGVRCSFPAGLENDDFLHLSDGEQTILIQKTKTPFLSAVQARLVTNKFLSGQMMANTGFPTSAKQLCVDLGENDFAFLREHKKIVVKPNTMDRGVGLSMGIETEEGLRQAYAKVSSYGAVLLERQVMGREYRLLVINNQVAGVLEWQVGENGEDIAIDRTSDANLSYRSLAIQVAQFFSIDVAGIDLICPDISEDFQPTRTAILEVNPGPDILWHLNPTFGQSQPVDDIFMNYLFPQMQL